ncbi:MAG: hypothetical protein IKO99_02875 [Bacteroidales bacterium]|nr:hypothetical protein [Bacteroidales bacterium]
MKRILLTAGMCASMLTASAQVKELEPFSISELQNPAAVQEEDGDDGPQDCFPVTNITATSRLAPQGNNNYNEKNLYDYNDFTPWVEGVKGYGIGEKVTFTLEDVSAGFTGISITNGYSKNQTAWKNNSRVKKLKLSVDGREKFILNLKDQMGEQVFQFGDDVVLNVVDGEFQEVFTVTIEILDVYKGIKYDDTAISEVTFLGCY